MMGIIDDYLNGSASSPSSGNGTTTSNSSPSLIQQYLDNVQPVEPNKNLKRVIIAPPISGASKEDSDAINAQPSVVGGANPRNSDLSEGIKNYPSNLWNDTKKGAAEGLNTALSGASDVVSNKPASGIGEIGLGILQALPVEPFINNTISKPVAELTGNPDIGDRAGFIASTALPVVPSAKLIKSKLPSNQALTQIVDKITSGGRDYQALSDTINAMKADSRIGPADTSPAVLNMTQKLFTTEGDAAKNYLHSVSSNRVTNLAGDVKGAFNEAAGVPVDTVQRLKDLSDAAKKVGNEKINPIVANAKPVDISNTIDSIDKVLKPGVNSVVSGESSLPLTNVKKELAQIRTFLANKDEMRTGAQDLHKFQSGLRTTGESLLSSADGGSRELGKAILNVRQSLVNDIDKAAPGYKEGLNAYRDEKHIADAFRDSYNGVFSNSTKMENRPEFTKQWFDGLTDQEKEAAREGARLAIDSKMGVSGNPSLAGTNLGRSDFNQQKLEMLFGKEETDKLLRNLENVRRIKDTHNKIIEGSQTEMRRAGDEAIALPEKKETNPLNKYIFPAVAAGAEYAAGGTGAGLLATGALATGAKVGSKVAHEIKTKMAKERNLNIAKLALPTEGPSRDQLIRDLESFLPGPKKTIVSRIGNAVRSLPIAP